MGESTLVTHVRAGTAAHDAVQLPGSYEGAVIQVAVVLGGAVLLPVVIYGRREMDFVLSGLAPSGLPALKLAVVVGDGALDHGAPDHGAIGYAELLRQPGGTYRQPRPDPDDRAVLLYTSGTTAEPKGVQHSHRTLLAEATSLVYTLNGPGARHLGLFPPGHMAGLLSLLRILLLGTPTVIMQAWDAELAGVGVQGQHGDQRQDHPAGLLAELGGGLAHPEPAEVGVSPQTGRRHELMRWWCGGSGRHRNPFKWPRRREPATGRVIYRTVGSWFRRERLAVPRIRSSTR